MKNITKIFIMGGAVVFLLLFGVGQYKSIKIRTLPLYSIVHKSDSGVMLIGGMGSDKDKIDSFKEDLEKDRQYWDYIHKASRYEEQGDYRNAIIFREKALELAEVDGDVWQARAGLGRLYGKLGEYDCALKEYDWLQTYQARIFKEAIAKNDKLGVDYRMNIIKELLEERKMVEEMKKTGKKTGDVSQVKKTGDVSQGDTPSSF